MRKLPWYFSLWKKLVFLTGPSEKKKRKKISYFSDVLMTYTSARNSTNQTIMSATSKVLVRRLMPRRWFVKIQKSCSLHLIVTYLLSSSSDCQSIIVANYKMDLNRRVSLCAILVILLSSSFDRVPCFKISTDAPGNPQISQSSYLSF